MVMRPSLGVGLQRVAICLLICWSASAASGSVLEDPGQHPNNTARVKTTVTNFADSFVRFPMSQTAAALRKLSSAAAWADSVLQTWAMKLEASRSLDPSPLSEGSKETADQALYYQCSITARSVDVCPVNVLPVYAVYGSQGPEQLESIEKNAPAASNGSNVLSGVTMQVDSAAYSHVQSTSSEGASIGISPALNSLLLEHPGMLHQLQMGSDPAGLLGCTKGVANTMMGSPLWLRSLADAMDEQAASCPVPSPLLSSARHADCSVASAGSSSTQGKHVTGIAYSPQRALHSTDDASSITHLTALVTALISVYSAVQHALTERRTGQAAESSTKDNNVSGSTTATASTQAQQILPTLDADVSTAEALVPATLETATRLPMQADPATPARRVKGASASPFAGLGKSTNPSFFNPLTFSPASNCPGASAPYNDTFSLAYLPAIRTTPLPCSQLKGIDGGQGLSPHAATADRSSSCSPCSIDYAAVAAAMSVSDQQTALLAAQQQAEAQRVQQANREAIAEVSGNFTAALVQERAASRSALVRARALCKVARVHAHSAMQLSQEGIKAVQAAHEDMQGCMGLHQKALQLQQRLSQTGLQQQMQLLHQQTVASTASGMRLYPACPTWKTKPNGSSISTDDGSRCINTSTFAVRKHWSPSNACIVGTRPSPSDTGNLSSDQHPSSSSLPASSQPLAVQVESMRSTVHCLQQSAVGHLSAWQALQSQLAAHAAQAQAAAIQARVQGGDESQALRLQLREAGQQLAAAEQDAQAAHASLKQQASLHAAQMDEMRTALSQLAAQHDALQDAAACWVQQRGSSSESMEDARMQSTGDGALGLADSHHPSGNFVHSALSIAPDQNHSGQAGWMHDQHDQHHHHQQSAAGNGSDVGLVGAGVFASPQQPLSLTCLRSGHSAADALAQEQHDADMALLARQHRVELSRLQAQLTYSEARCTELSAAVARLHGDVDVRDQLVLLMAGEDSTPSPPPSSRASSRIGEPDMDEESTTDDTPIEKQPGTGVIMTSARMTPCMTPAAVASAVRQDGLVASLQQRFDAFAPGALLDRPLAALKTELLQQQGTPARAGGRARSTATTPAKQRFL